MDITRESGNWTQAGADMTEDTECKTADRYHVDSLLNISEESFAALSLYGMPVQTAWEQVVKGWNECPPLACLFQLQNTCKPVKTGEHEFHCLLCIDANFVQKPEEDHCVNSESSVTICSLPEEHKGENSLCPPIHLEALEISPSENSCLDTEQDNLKYEKTTTIQAESSKVIGRARPPDTLPKLTYMKLAMQCPIMKEKGIINKFSVLPPVKGSGYPRRARLRSLAASTLSSSGSLTAENISYGLPLTGEGNAVGEDISPGTNSGAEALEDGNRSFTAKCYQSTSSKQLLSTFSIRLSKRSSLNSFDDTLSRAADLVGRKIKNASPIRADMNNNQAHNQKRTETELPILFGTRVPMQAMAHRIVYTSHA